jgi:hypothetical protein
MIFFQLCMWQKVFYNILLHLELCKSPSKMEEMVFQRLYSFKISLGTWPRTPIEFHLLSPTFGGRYSVPPTFTTALTPLTTFKATPVTEQPNNLMGRQNLFVDIFV